MNSLRVVDIEPDEELSILLRHAHRPNIPNGVIEHHGVPLSQKGRKMAYAFGGDLPNHTPIRLFYSPIPRCKETAECIKNGVNSNAGSAVLVGERDFLGTHYEIDLRKIIDMMERVGSLTFLRKWFNRELNGNIIADPYKVVSRILTGLVISKKEKNANQRTVDFHITHDLNILAVRELLLDAKLEDVGWPDYLDGIVLTHSANKISLRWRNIKNTIELSSIPSLSNI